MQLNTLGGSWGLVRSDKSGGAMPNIAHTGSVDEYL